MPFYRRFSQDPIFFSHSRHLGFASVFKHDLYFLFLSITVFSFLLHMPFESMSYIHSINNLQIIVSKFADKIKEFISECGNTDVNQYLILVKLNFLKQETGFSGMDFFKMKSNTIFSVFALILSISVILKTRKLTRSKWTANIYS